MHTKCIFNIHKISGAECVYNVHGCARVYRVVVVVYERTLKDGSNAYEYIRLYTRAERLHNIIVIIIIIFRIYRTLVSRQHSRRSRRHSAHSSTYIHIIYIL